MSDFVGVWQRIDLLFALTLLDRDHQPITVGLANLPAPHQENLLLPPLLVFALLNRNYVRGLLAGGING
jgi:ABC-type glycerol-3-phosphate transport system permease component